MDLLFSKIPEKFDNSYVLITRNTIAASLAGVLAPNSMEKLIHGFTGITGCSHEL